MFVYSHSNLPMKDNIHMIDSSHHSHENLKFQRKHQGEENS